MIIAMKFPLLFFECVFCLCRDAVAHLFEAWMPSYVPQMVLLTFVVTKVRPAAGNGKPNNTGNGLASQVTALRRLSANAKLLCVFSWVRERNPPSP